MVPFNSKNAGVKMRLMTWRALSITPYGEAEVAAPPEPEPELPPTGNGVAMRILSAAGAKWLPFVQASAGIAWPKLLKVSLNTFANARFFSCIPHVFDVWHFLPGPIHW